MGKFFFKYRGQIPALILMLAYPIIVFTNNINISFSEINYDFLSIPLITIGCLIRYHTIGFSFPKTSGRNRNSQVAEKLNKLSLYSITRNPLYLGNMIIWFGIVLRTNNLVYILFCMLSMLIMFNFIINHEENFLKIKFKNEYNSWKKITPRLIPNFLIFKKSNNKFSFKALLRREYSGLLAIFFSILYIDAIEFYISNNTISINYILLYLCLGMIIISLILKYLRKNTVFLDD